MSGLREERSLGAVMAVNIAIIWEGQVAGSRGKPAPTVGVGLPREKARQEGSVARIDSR